MLTRQMLFAAATAALIGTGIAAGASAQPGPGGPGGWHHGGGGLLEGVTLTDDQKAALHTLMQNGHAATRVSVERRHLVRRGGGDDQPPE